VALLWRFRATNHPEEHPRVNAAELALIYVSESGNVTHAPLGQAQRERAPWGRILTSGSVWGLILSYPCIVYPAYIFYTWFFMYLGEARGLTIQQGGLWGSTPFLAIVVLLPLGGWVSDRFVARMGKRRGRKCAVWLGATLSAILLWIGGHSSNTTGAILLLAGAAGFNLFATATWWATCNDLTKEHSGSLSGVMNMFGNPGAGFCWLRHPGFGRNLHPGRRRTKPRWKKSVTLCSIDGTRFQHRAAAKQAGPNRVQPRDIAGGNGNIRPQACIPRRRSGSRKSWR
jgi:sugar phosphate permease